MSAKEGGNLLKNIIAVQQKDTEDAIDDNYKDWLKLNSIAVI